MGKINWGCLKAVFGIIIFYLAISYLHFTFTSTEQIDTNTFIQLERVIERISNFQASSLVLSEFSKEADNNWLDVLKYGEIIVARPFKGNDAYAEKFIVYFNGGKKGSLKLIERSSLFDREVRSNVIFDEEENKGGKRVEAGEYQGMPELVAFHLDRILQFYKKPPTAGRIVPSSLLYRSFLSSLLPSYDIAVIVHAWTSGLKKEDPPIELRKYSVLDQIKKPITDSIKNYIKEMSDTLVFDFLVDDHDRAAEKNWIINQKKEIIHWDSGLGWHHGPFADPSCLDILCGSNIWRRRTFAETGQTTQCQRMCVFNNKTIELLKSMGPLAGPTNKLGYLLRNSLEVNEKLFPLFQYPIYYSNFEQKEMIKYEVESFFTGMDVKLSRLLNHVDNCISKHGADIVLLN